MNTSRSAEDGVAAMAIAPATVAATVAAATSFLNLLGMTFHSPEYFCVSSARLTIAPVAVTGLELRRVGVTV